MGLIGNHIRLNTGVQQVRGDVQSRTAGNFARYSSMCYTRSQSGATTVISGTAIPSGGYPSATYYPPQEVGEMSFRVYGQGQLTATLVPTLPMSIDKHIYLTVFSGTKKCYLVLHLLPIQTTTTFAMRLKHGKKQQTGTD
jgi:hypothetical protein